MCICRHVKMCALIRVFVSARMHKSIQICTNTHNIYMCVCMHISPHTYIYAYKHTHNHIRMHSSVPVCMCTSLHTHEYMRVYMHTVLYASMCSSMWACAPYTCGCGLQPWWRKRRATSSCQQGSWSSALQPRPQNRHHKVLNYTLWRTCALHVCK